MRKVTKETSKRKSHIVLLLSGLAFSTISFFLLIDKDTSKSTNLGLQNTTDKPELLKSRVVEIASKFICACGSCSGESLEICTCEHANKMRQVISDYLLEEKSPDQIVTLLARSYGGLKPLIDKNKLDEKNIRFQ